MQNSTPSRNPVSSQSLLQTLLEHAFLGARPASPGAAPTGGDVPGANAAPAADPIAGDVASDTTDTADMPAVGGLELAELLGVLRDPIEWVFTLAERRAHGEPLDIAAIHRVRDAVLHRVNAAILKIPETALPPMRAVDLWTVGERLIDALDPSLVARVLHGFGTSLTQALAAGLSFAPALVADPGGAAATIPVPHVPLPVPPPWHGAPVWPLRGPCGGACGGLCPAALAAAHALRPTFPPITPPWWWSQVSVPL